MEPNKKSNQTLLLIISKEIDAKTVYLEDCPFGINYTKVESGEEYIRKVGSKLCTICRYYGGIIHDSVLCLD